MMAAHYRTRFKLDIVFFSASGKPYKSMPMGSAANNHTRIQDSKFQILNLKSEILNLKSGI